jgi:hypothetical protein
MFHGLKIFGEPAQPTCLEVFSLMCIQFGLLKLLLHKVYPGQVSSLIVIKLSLQLNLLIFEPHYFEVCVFELLFERKRRKEIDLGFLFLLLEFNFL